MHIARASLFRAARGATRNASATANRDGMAPLSTAEADAWEAFLRLRRSDRKLIDGVVAKLVAYFKAKGVTLDEVDKDPPSSVAALADYEEEWRDYAVAAGIDDVADKGNLVRYMRTGACAPGEGRGAGPAAAVADALSAAGLTLSKAQHVAVSTALRVANAGEADSQCTGATCIFLLYLGRVGTGEDLEWFEPQLSAAQASGTDPSGPLVTVDFKSLPSYSKMHLKTTNTTLERALQSPRAELWNHYSSKLMDNLGAHGLPYAAQRMMKLVSMSRAHFGNDWALEREYLSLIFFDLWLGRGILEGFSVRATVMLQASPASRALKMQVNLAPVPGQLGSNPADGGMGHFGWPNTATWPQPAVGYPPAVHYPQQPTMQPAASPRMEAMEAQLQELLRFAQGQQGSNISPQGRFMELPGPPDEEQQEKCEICHSTRHKTKKCSFFNDAKKAAKAATEAKKARAAAAAAGADPAAAAAAAAAAANAQQ